MASCSYWQFANEIIPIVRLGTRIVGPEVDHLIPSDTEPLADAGPTVPLHRRTLPKWGLAVTAISLLILGQCGFRLMRGRMLAKAAVEHFHEALNAGRYEQIFREADPGLVEGKTEEELVGFLQTVHTKLGDAGAMDLVSINIMTRTIITVRTAVPTIAMAT